METEKNLDLEIVNDEEVKKDEKIILEVKNLRKCFPVKKSLTGKVLKELVAVDNVSFTLNAGETIPKELYQIVAAIYAEVIYTSNKMREVK